MLFLKQQQEITALTEEIKILTYMVPNIAKENIYINMDKEINVTISKDNVKATKSEKLLQC